jgi:hypothetical protein
VFLIGTSATGPNLALHRGPPKMTRYIRTAALLHGAGQGHHRESRGCHCRALNSQPDCAFVGEEPGGLAATTSSDVPLAHYVAAVDAILAGRTDVDGSIDAALAHDENMAMALVVRSLRMRLRGEFEGSIAAFRRAGVAARGATERERSVVAFFDAFFGSDRFEAERRGLDHLRSYPRDRLVVLYMHFLYNMMLPAAE